MLIVNRKIGESLVFTNTVTGEVINVQVRGKSRDSVGFAINAPNHIRVERPERKNHAGNQPTASETRFDEGIDDDADQQRPAPY